MITPWDGIAPGVMVVWVVFIHGVIYAWEIFIMMYGWEGGRRRQDTEEVDKTII